MEVISLCWPSYKSIRSIWMSATFQNPYYKPEFWNNKYPQEVTKDNGAQRGMNDRYKHQMVLKDTWLSSLVKV